MFLRSAATSCFFVEIYSIGTCNEQVALDVGKLTLKSIEHSSMFVASAKVWSE